MGRHPSALYSPYLNADDLYSTTVEALLPTGSEIHWNAALHLEQVSLVGCNSWGTDSAKEYLESWLTRRLPHLTHVSSHALYSDSVRNGTIFESRDDSCNILVYLNEQRALHAQSVSDAPSQKLQMPGPGLRISRYNVLELQYHGGRARTKKLSYLRLS